MYNIYDMLDVYAKQNASMYGDLLEGTNKEEILFRNMTTDERIAYEEIKEADKQRLLRFS